MSKEENKVELLVADTNQHGKTICLPLAGDVTVSESGIIELDAEHASFIEKNCEGFDYANKQSKDDSEDDGLMELDLKDLVQLCVESEIPLEDYKKFKANKKAMVAFLRKRALEQNEEEEDESNKVDSSKANSTEE